MRPSPPAELVVSDLVVEYRSEGYVVRAIDRLGFEAQRGELVVLLGPSGSGKTSLLSCLGGILSPTSGELHLGATDITALRGKALDDYRRSTVGFVFQAFNLIPSLSARENVAIPLVLGGTPRADAMAKADQLLERVDLADHADRRPHALSGGQQQRVAVARGVANDPALLLADEPTANLDHIQAEGVIRLLRELRDDSRVIIVSTHDARLVPVADRVVQMTTESAETADEPVRVEYEAGEVIFEQGGRADHVYVIESGTVEILRMLADGGSERLAELGEGQYFGELGALLGFPRSADARARTKVVLTAFGPSHFRRTIQSTQQAER